MKDEECGSMLPFQNKSILSNVLNDNRGDRNNDLAITVQNSFDAMLSYRKDGMPQ